MTAQGGPAGTPEQQAALRWLQTEARTVYLDALSRTGSATAAAEIARIDPDTALYWQKHDDTFAEQCHQAERKLSHRMRAKMVAAIIDAPSEALLNHPNAYFFEQKRLDHGYREGAGNTINLNIDARQLTIGDFKAAIRQRRQFAAAGELEEPQSLPYIESDSEEGLADSD